MLKNLPPGLDRLMSKEDREEVMEKGDTPQEEAGESECMEKVEELVKEYGVEQVRADLDKVAAELAEKAGESEPGDDADYAGSTY